MKDKFQTFFNTWNGKPCEVSDPSNLNQCFDLAYAWLDVLQVTRDSIRHLYASEIYSKPTDLTVKFFELVPNTALFIPQIGDICVFKGGTAGHVSVANGVGDTNTFQSFDQNWGSTVNKCGLITHAYDNLLGVLRLRVPCDETTVTDQTLLDTKSDGKQELQAIRSMLEDRKNTIVNDGKTIADLSLSISGLNAKITDLEKQISDHPVINYPDYSLTIGAVTSVVWNKWTWFGKNNSWKFRLDQLKALLPK